MRTPAKNGPSRAPSPVGARVAVRAPETVGGRAKRGPPADERDPGPVRKDERRDPEHERDREQALDEEVAGRDPRADEGAVPDGPGIVASRVGPGASAPERPTPNPSRRDSTRTIGGRRYWPTSMKTWCR